MTLPTTMKFALLLCCCLSVGFGASLPAATLAPLGTVSGGVGGERANGAAAGAPSELASWPGGNKRARRITRRARKRTLGITKFTALKVMKRRKSRRKKLRRNGSRDKAGKSALPVKKTGCPGD